MEHKTLLGTFLPHSPKHRTYICVRLTDGTAMIFSVIPLLYSFPKQVTYGGGLFPSVRERERE